VPKSKPRRSTTPPVSVVMPVHNALPHLDAAVQSILGQTFADFEFVILDDGSTDGSRERLREWGRHDTRIKLIEVERNLGPALSSDRVARAGSAPVIARMDADDISYPNRLEKQVAVLEHNPDVGVVGGLYEYIDTAGRMIRNAETWRLSQPAVIPPFGNGPLTYRREVYEKVGGYREECEFWEDKDLIVRMAAVTKVMVIPAAIYQIRQSTTSTRVVSEQGRLERAVDLAFRCIQRLEQGQGYEDLLANRKAYDEKLTPRVFISLGSVILWARGRPRFFRRLLRRGKLELGLPTALALVWTAWASAEPHSLRLFLRFLHRLRQASASVPVQIDGLVSWSPSTGDGRDQLGAG